ncbi:MAG TPA: hypothetical protein V6C63_07635 [Allocoleopsis sp.]
MSLYSEFEEIRKVLAFYASPENYNDDGIAGEQILFGWEHDCGQRAQVALQKCDRLLHKLAQMEQPPKPEKQKSAIVSSHNLHIDVWTRCFASTNLIPLLAQAWQGWTHSGPGAIFIGCYWSLQQGLLKHQVQSSYLDLSSIEPQAEEPIRSEIIAKVADYDPVKEAIVVFYGNDLSQGGRFKLSLDRNFIKCMAIASEEFTAAECAEKLGIVQEALSADTGTTTTVSPLQSDS